MKYFKISEPIRYIILSIVLLYFATSGVFNLKFSIVLIFYGMIAGVKGLAMIEDIDIEKSIRRIK